MRPIDCAPLPALVTAPGGPRASCHHRDRQSLCCAIMLCAFLAERTCLLIYLVFYSYQKLVYLYVWEANPFKV